MTPTKDISAYLAPVDGVFGDLLRCIDANRSGIALVVDADGRLLATATDGDLRRATLSRVTVETPIADLLAEGRISRNFVALGPADDAAAAEALIAAKKIRHVPRLDADGRPVDLYLQDELARRAADPEAALGAVVMAGGFGTRMRPLTQETPKPMLPVDGQPLLERMIRHMNRSGIEQVHITTHYLKEKITEHFGDGEGFGVDLAYVDEEKPMGTAGALRLMARPSSATLIINGDVLTDLDFRAMHRFHQEHGALMTMAVRDYSLQVPYGVVESDGVHVSRVVEKPRHDYFINAGIYIIEPAAIDHIPEGVRFDMTDLVDALLADGETVTSFPLREYWLDIGCQEDYARAQIDVQSGKVKA